MELNTQTIVFFGIGLATGFLSFALVLPFLNRWLRLRYRTQVAGYEKVIVGLRQERADDRETNRRLRRELAVTTPENFVANSEERDLAVGEVERLKSELFQSARQLADRDRSLREARLAIHEIRVQLEEGPVLGLTTSEHALGTILDEQVEGDNGSEVVEGPGPLNDEGYGDPAAMLLGDHPVGEATTP